jgi:TolB-like protein
MEKKPSLSRQRRLLKSEKWRPYIRFKKETGEWIAKAIREERSGEQEMEKTMDQVSSKIKISMDRKELDIIARLVAYMYHDKKDEYEEIASDLRKEHIYSDLRSIDQWLNIQYQRLEAKDERNKRINKLDQEIINEQSEQDKGKHL